MRVLSLVLISITFLSSTVFARSKNTYEQVLTAWSVYPSNSEIEIRKPTIEGGVAFVDGSKEYLVAVCKAFGFSATNAQVSELMRYGFTRTYAVQDETGKFIRRDDNQEKRHVIERLRCNLASHIANLDRVSAPRRTVVYTYQPHIEDLAKNNGFEIENIDFVYSK